MSIDTQLVQKEFDRRIESAKNIKDLDRVHLDFLGKKGAVNQLTQNLARIPKDQRVSTGKKINELKKHIVKGIKEAEKRLKNNLKEKVEDLTIPVKPFKTGNLHPITTVTRDLNNFFHYYGFSQYDGPEIEDNYHNFEMMGVPKDHPARDLQDTLYIKEPEILLRTQTSSVEARQLEKRKPPIRFVCPGKVFRNETSNKSNSSLFHHYQGVYVDTSVTMRNLKWLFVKSLKHILGKNIEIRFRAKYYPEVEPGLSPDIKCTFCNGKGCDICKNRGWVEIAGGGMIHPRTLSMAGIDPEKYSGLAFGWGLDRIAMAKFNIKDIRLLFSGSIIYN